MPPSHVLSPSPSPHPPLAPPHAPIRPPGVFACWIPNSIFSLVQHIALRGLRSTPPHAALPVGAAGLASVGTATSMPGGALGVAGAALAARPRGIPEGGLAPPAAMPGGGLAPPAAVAGLSAAADLGKPAVPSAPLLNVPALVTASQALLRSKQPAQAVDLLWPAVQQSAVRARSSQRGGESVLGAVLGAGRLEAWSPPKLRSPHRVFRIGACHPPCATYTPPPGCTAPPAPRRAWPLYHRRKPPLPYYRRNPPARGLVTFGRPPILVDSWRSQARFASNWRWRWQCNGSTRRQRSSSSRCKNRIEGGTGDTG